jgi:EAL domain-containing protein (putative c-di-GMP-specific phosphodiesterase class I)
LHSVAEGAEDQGILDELLKLGCDGAQGYHMSRPVDPGRVAEVVRDYPGRVRTAA